MIIDTLPNAFRYYTAHERFEKAFLFIERAGAILPDGLHAIDGENIFAIISLSQGRGKKHARLETHRRYIDIQVILEGSDTIGLRQRGACTRPSESYNAKKDIEFFDDIPDEWQVISPGMFAVFFPDDAHAPLAGDTPVRKLVVKVLVEQNR